MLVRPTTRSGVHYALVIAAGSSLAIMAALGLGRLSYPVILPIMQQALRLSSTQSGLLATSTLVGYLFASAAGGAVAACVGARRTILFSLGLSSASLMLTGLAPSLEVALIGQFLNGIGAGAATISSMGLAVAWFAPSHRGRANGVVSAGAGPGMLVAGMVLPWFTGGADWRAGWFCLAALVLSAAVLCGLILRDEPEELGIAPLGAATDGERLAKTSLGRRPPSFLEREAWITVLRIPIFWHLGLVWGLYGLVLIHAETSEVDE